jgi:uncharacterized membrane protein YfcA
MPEFLRVIGGVAAFVCLVGVVWTFQEWRDRRTRQQAAAAPQSELGRASKLAQRFGTAVVWCITAASGLAMAASFLALFFGLFFERVTFADLGYLLVILVVAGLVYLWANRILQQLVD